MRWRAVAVAAAFVVAGCSGFTAADRPETVTPAPVPAEPTGPAAVPGLTNDSVASADTLARAHRRALYQRSYTLTLQWTVGARDGRTRLAVESERRYHYRSEQRGGGYSDRTFVDGAVRYDRYRRPLGMKFVRGQSVPAHDRFGHVTGRLVRSFLPAGPAAVESHPDGYELVVRRAPDGFERVDRYVVRAVVAPSGLVRSFVVSYRNTERNATADHRFRYTDLGTTTVERPAWVRERWPDETRRGTATTTPYDSG
ncbi:hypothetical protein EGH21_12415 [Halomicroarcula sp. F13]|uniref:Outer membrane lipoprotein-sorting protein n=1 Tax=Haloarcula rubra TaxID=2487747 RepID=A0AAW4PUK4_9EURY|nr:hypothetical protein [Halomicroarcula rubra]MBX0323834.1 hypothetical protein [Halomicroarcula rubra]